MATSAQVRRRLAAAGLRISAGKMSGWWSTTPLSIRLDDLEVLCAVLACEPSDLLVREATAPCAEPWLPPVVPASGSVPAQQRKGPLRRLVPPL
jgi:DNA-binding Xre family transcriptional regulator